MLKQFIILALSGISASTVYYVIKSIQHSLSSKKSFYDAINNKLESLQQKIDNMLGTIERLESDFNEKFDSLRNAPKKIEDLTETIQHVIKTQKAFSASIEALAPKILIAEPELPDLKKSEESVKISPSMTQNPPLSSPARSWILGDRSSRSSSRVSSSPKKAASTVSDSMNRPA